MLGLPPTAAQTQRRASFPTRPRWSGLHLPNPQAPEVTCRCGSLRDNSVRARGRLTAGVKHSSPDTGHMEATQPRSSPIVPTQRFLPVLAWDPNFVAWKEVQRGFSDQLPDTGCWSCASAGPGCSGPFPDGHEDWHSPHSGSQAPQSCPLPLLPQELDHQGRVGAPRAREQARRRPLHSGHRAPRRGGALSSGLCCSLLSTTGHTSHLSPAPWVLSGPRQRGHSQKPPWGRRTCGWSPVRTPGCLACGVAGQPGTYALLGR